MKTIDLTKIIEGNNLEVKAVAAELFPCVKYPKLALDRILKGESKLDSDQLSRLSTYTGLEIEELYSGKNWRVKSKEGMIILEAEEYRAVINTQAWTTTLFHKKTILHDTIIHNNTISLDQYIKKLNTIINNYNT